MPTLEWIGKNKIINHHQQVPFRILERQYSFDLQGQHDKDNKSENMIIHGDNLEALKALLPQYEGKVKCIYIDPPYNTGNEGWVYNDNVNDPKIKRWLGEVVGKEGEDLSRHDKWLCMIYPRLKLLHKLLKDDGAIFISIDDNEQANLKAICDEIFGSNNFINNIIWQKKQSPQNDAQYFSDDHDFIICYAKNKKNWNRNYLKRSDKQLKNYKNPDNDERGLWASSDLTVKTYTENYDYPITTPSGVIIHPTNGRCWMTSKENMQKLVEDNRIWFGKKGDSVPRYKTFLDEVNQGIVPTTVWLYDEVGSTQSAKQDLKKMFSNSKTPFETPKPLELIRKIIDIAMNYDDILLDSFAGSGTTAHAILNANKENSGKRKFILIEMEDYAESLTAERVRRAIKGFGDSKKTEGTKGDFSYFELGEPMLLSDGNLNENVDAHKIREYVYYMDTKEPLSICANADNKYFLGKNKDTVYYFFYEKAIVTTLDHNFLATVKEKADGYIIYADLCTLSDRELKRYNIVFKKIPRDIAKL